MNPLLLAWRWLERRIKFRILHVNDSPHRIALGVALGAAIAVTPAIGLQTVILILLALLVRANVMAGVPLLLLSNPFTLVPVYAPSYYLGSRMLGARADMGKFAGDVSAAMRAADGFFAKVQAWWRVTLPYALPLWVGSLVVAAALGILAYVVTRWTVTAYRRRRPQLELPLSGKDKL